MGALSDLANRAARLDRTVDEAVRGAPKPTGPAPTPEQAKLIAELQRLRKSNDPISAAPRKTRIAKIEGILTEQKYPIPGMQAPLRGRVRAGSGRNRYVLPEATRDESMDLDARYPLHRLDREPTAKSAAAAHIAAEAARVRRIFGPR